MTETREFHIGDILSIIDGHLVSPRHIDGVYDILNWMTGDNLFTHQLPRASEECAPSLREQHPDLAAVVFPEGVSGEEPVRAWLAEQVRQFGEHRPVSPLAVGDHTAIDPISEMKMIRPDMPIIGIATE